MTTPDPRPADGPPKLTAETSEPARSGGVHQPWRAAVAGIELVLAVLLVVFAWWAWGQGKVTIALPGPGGAVDVVTRSVGSWLSGAVGAVTVAGLLVLDAARQVVLAVRVRRRA
ncbi:hypothetical protein GCM10011581_32870 [Saccharopolyspora subtropica]|uniref:Uncharacterized protein n=1 Tax=Saccharopolyspora thermophila TaxID=89367 RepID=A0A917JYQ2_9PSEU|nr:hypothetical protein [Saccharopolyspora subtropica]GGI93193.1 hypothetical protein GCM10011581_32870 [Saccharopolyspora subtropica]